MKLQGDIRHISPFQIIILGFLSVILLGTVLLMLPIATVDRTWTGFVEAMFTSVSATCVTGLVVYNTAEYWSVFGQVVILCLIQIGGMGVVTIAISIARFSGKKIGLVQRNTMQEAISAHQLGGIVKMTNFIFRMVLIIELVGAVFLAPTFCKECGIKGIWYALFHSISAFCNAGFDILEQPEGNSSLMQYAGNPFINLPIMLLIILGGIGFMTWDDIRQNKHRIRKYRMQTKMVLLVTFLLLILPFLYYFFFEFSRKCWDMTLGEQLLASLFQSVTPRTAGFNTVELTQMTDVSKFLMVILMLIGGSSGSTAGGFKVTTLAVLFMTIWAVFHHSEEIQSFGRRLSPQSVFNAVTIFLLYIVLFIIGGFTISMVDAVPLLDALFESASAIGTVGLSLDLTPRLGTVSRWILMLLMFFGRVGGLTLIFAVISEKHPVYSKYPEDKMTVG